MILDALYRLAEREGLMTDPDFEVKPVAWLVRVDDGGTLVGIEGTHYLPEPVAKRKPRPRAKNMRIPRQPTGRAGIKAPAAFLVDNAKYVFGKATRDKQFSAREGAEKASWFRKMVKDCAAETRDPGVLAVAAFLERDVDIDLPVECRSNELFAFVYAPDVDSPVHERTAVRDYWASQRSPVATDDSTTDHECIVTGEPVGETPLVPLLKKVRGGTPSGVALVSFNSNAFESHGWDANENAPLSRGAAEAVATALNRLLDPAFPDSKNPSEALPRRNYVLGADTVVCYWASERDADGFLDSISALFDGDDAGLVEDVYRGLWRGRFPNVRNAARFYALTITGTQGRAILRDWFESSLQDVLRNLARYFEDLDIVRNAPRPKKKDLPVHPPLGVLLTSLAPRGKSAGVPAPLATQFVRAALRGSPYPVAVLQTALARNRAEIGRTEWHDLERRDARAALIKAVLRRNTAHKELTPTMDPTNTQPGYILGRLMAVLERLQQVALGDVNATVVDRFFSAASATPQAVFPRLLKSARHHARKAQDEPKTRSAAIWLDRQIDAVIAPLGIHQHRQGLPYTGFPAHLPLDQQGLFVLGYHQQRHWLWLSKDERERLASGSNLGTTST